MLGGGKKKDDKVDISRAAGAPHTSRKDKFVLFNVPAEESAVWTAARAATEQPKQQIIMI